MAARESPANTATTAFGLSRLLFEHETDFAIPKFKKGSTGRMYESDMWRRLLSSGIDTLAVPDAQHFQKWNMAWLRPYAYICGVYILATWLTRSFFQGDTVDYVASIVAHMSGGYYKFWDFGHLLWRPFGWLAFRVSRPFLAGFVGSDERVQITLVLIVISWLAGLASAFLLLALLRLYCARGWIPTLVVTSFVFSMAE